MIEGSRRKLLIEELLAHLPFTVFFTAAGLLMAGLLQYVAIVGAPVVDHGDDEISEYHEHSPAHDGGEHGHAEPPVNPHLPAASRTVFHLFHPIHLLFSALATTAMFWRHEKRIGKAILIGFVGSVGICGLSDIFMPYLAGRLMKLSGMQFHWCLIEHPQMVLPFIALGIACGILAPGKIAHSTQFSHSSHVFVSVIASLFYLIAFGVDNWVHEDIFPSVFVIVILCVSLPCCLSDIIFPCLTVSCSGAHCHSGVHGHEG